MRHDHVDRGDDTSDTTRLPACMHDTSLVIGVEFSRLSYQHAQQRDYGFLT